MNDNTIITNFNIRHLVRLYLQNPAQLPERFRNISNWDVSQVRNMSELFKDATNFNEPLNTWDVSQVRYMREMFKNASSFNQPLNLWDVSHVNDMSGMFKNATSFNQPLNNWHVSPTLIMDNMFDGAEQFNQEDFMFVPPPINVGRNRRREQRINQVRNQPFIPLHHRDLPNPNRPQLMGNNEGIAYQIHNTFKSITPEQFEFLLNLLKSRSDKPDNFYSSMDHLTFLNYLFDKLESNLNVEMRNAIQRGLQGIRNKLRNASSPIASRKILLGRILDYVFAQSDTFKEEYVKMYFQDNLQAYGAVTSLCDSSNIDNNNLSCVEGLYERFVTTLRDVSIQMCCTGAPEEYCLEEYKNILENVFSVNVNKCQMIDLNETIKQWFLEHLNNEEYKQAQDPPWVEGELNEHVKQDFIDFMINKYKEMVEPNELGERIVAPGIINKINSEANHFENAGIFRNLSFGGKRRNKRRKSHKRLQSHKHRRTYKRRQTHKHRRTHNRRQSHKRRQTHKRRR